MQGRLADALPDLEASVRHSCIRGADDRYVKHPTVLHAVCEARFLARTGCMVTAPSRYFEAAQIGHIFNGTIKLVQVVT